MILSLVGMVVGLRDKNGDILVFLQGPRFTRREVRGHTPTHIINEVGVGKLFNFLIIIMFLLFFTLLLL